MITKIVNFSAFELMLALIFVIIITIAFSSCKQATEPANKLTNPLETKYLNYDNWYDTSIPAQIEDVSALSPAELMNYKAKMYWYNISPPDVSLRDILVNSNENIQTSVLDLVYNPAERGCYNTDTLFSTSDSNWGGTIFLIDKDDRTFVNDNFDTGYLSLWLNFEDKLPGGYLTIDLGRISEDVIPNHILDTEDKNHNGILDAGEDTGLDGLTDKQEPGYNSSNQDPENDDYSYTAGINFERINNPEGNQKLNMEDINYNGTLDLVNSYYSYKIPLNYDNNPYIDSAVTSAGWAHMKIKLTGFTSTTGVPSKTNLDSFRIWISGINKIVRIRFAEIKFDK